MNTHEVLDLHCHADESQECFAGTEQECIDFVATQSPYFMYKVVPIIEPPLIDAQFESIVNYLDNRK